MRIKLIDVDSRLNIKYNKVDGIYSWGDDNAYPHLIKSLIGSSVTAKNCVDLNAKYIYGKGFQFAGKTVMVNKNGLTINQLLRVASKEFSEQNNLFFHVNYNALHEITGVVLIPSTDARIGKADSQGYSGKFIIYDNWDKSKGKKVEKKDFTIIDRFNPSPAVIEAQVEAAGGWNKYKGQILHITSDFSDIYSLSDGDCALKDMDCEDRASTFKNAGLRRGFFGSKLITVKPFDDDFDKDGFDRMIKDLVGVENSSGVATIELKSAADVISEEIDIKDIDSNYTDTNVEYTEASSAKKIRKAFGVPSILIEDSDNSIFGDSGALLKQAKLTHWENKEEERNIVTEAFQRIFSRWHEPINPQNDWSITPIITLDTNTTTNVTVN